MADNSPIYRSPFGLDFCLDDYPYNRIDFDSVGKDYTTSEASFMFAGPPTLKHLIPAPQVWVRDRNLFYKIVEKGKVWKIDTRTGEVEYLNNCIVVRGIWELASIGVAESLDKVVKDVMVGLSTPLVSSYKFFGDKWNCIRRLRNLIIKEEGRP